MAKSFNLGVSKYIPNAEIVIDNFHFSCNFYKKYVKKIFENEIKKQKKSIKIMNKNTQNKENFNETSKKTLEDLIEINQKTIVCKFLLRKNRKNINEDDKKIIDFVSENSENINEIVEIKYKIDELLDSKDYEYCKKEWLNLFEKCKNSTIPELRRFYKFNCKYIETLPNSALFDISNGFIEGNNRNINLYYNRARGFKDIDYFLNLIMYFSYKKAC
jgi:transposase